MQNLASAFPHLAFQQQNQTEKPDTQLPPEFQFLLSASLDQGLYANQLAALKNSTSSANTTTTSSAPTSNGISPDFASFLLSTLSQQQNQPQTSSTEVTSQSQIPQVTPSNAVTQSLTSSNPQEDLAQLMALIAGPQQSNSQMNAAVANNLLEQMQFFNQQSFNLATSQPQNSVVPTTPTSSGSGGGNFFGGANTSLNSPNKDSYCEFCDKNFCNRYFLRIHKQKKHGVQIDGGNVPDTPPAKIPRLESSASPVKQPEEEPKPKESVGEMPNNIEAILAAFQESQSNKAGSQPDLLSIIQQLARGKTPEARAEKFGCDKCSQDFSSTSLLLQHQLTHHSIVQPSSPPTSTPSSQANLLSMMPSGFQNLPFMLPQLSSNFPSLEMENAFSSHPAINGLNQSMMSKQSAPKRQYSSTTKNYCDLCNKEVCNKYFLRTHMLKMHNIVIDENKTVIANIDTQEKEKEGSVSFRCDVCHLDMKTRMQLKEHKKSAHGIQPVIAPSSASSQISCSSSASKPPSTSNSALGSGASQGTTTAFEFPPTTSPRTSPPPSTDFACNHCDAEFDTIQDLLNHLSSEHENEFTQEELLELFTKATTSASQGFAPDATFPSGQAVDTVGEQFNEEKLSTTEDENDDAMAITREVALKMVAENQALQVKDEDARIAPNVFPCNTCNRNYTTQQNLDDHASTVHQYKIKLSPKKEAKMILSPSKVNKMIKCFTCGKCNQRFATSHLCRMHIIQHLRRELKTQDVEMKDISGESSSATDELKENKDIEDFDDALISSFMREESSRDKTGSMIEHVVSELSRRGSHGGLAKLPEEKHSHTSGSASPMSVHTMPEAYAQPLPGTSSSPKPFVLQSFVMREVSESNAFSNELHAYLPVRALLDGPIRVTFELQPAPHFDAQIKNL